MEELHRGTATGKRPLEEVERSTREANQAPFRRQTSRSHELQQCKYQQHHCRGTSAGNVVAGRVVRDARAGGHRTSPREGQDDEVRAKRQRTEKTELQM